MNTSNDFIKSLYPYVCKETARISNLVGSGLIYQKSNNEHISVFFEQQIDVDAMWLRLKVKLGLKDLFFFVKEEQFNSWIGDNLTVNCFSDIPREFLGFFSNYIIDDFDCLIKDKNNTLKVSDPITRIHDQIIYKGTHLRFSFYKNDMQLDFFILENLKIAELLFEKMQKNKKYAEIPYKLECVLGTTRLKYSVLQSLHVGDVVFFSCVCDFNSGEMILFEGIELMTIQKENGVLKVKGLFDKLDDFEQNSEKELYSAEEIYEEDKRENILSKNSFKPENIEITLYVEAGYFKTTISGLSNLSVGDIISGEIYQASELKIKLKGKTIGTGSLIQVEEKIGIRIDKLSQ